MLPKSFEYEGKPWAGNGCKDIPPGCTQLGGVRPQGCKLYQHRSRGVAVCEELNRNNIEYSAKNTRGGPSCGPGLYSITVPSRPAR